MATRDLRKAQRIAVELPMRLTLANGEAFDIRTWDFSDSGVFVAVDQEIMDKATVNSIVRVQFQGTNHTPPIVSAKVLRKTDKGLALVLQDTLVDGDAPNK